MSTTISRYLLAGAFALASSLSGAAGESTNETLVVSSGLEGGGYWNAASRLSSVAEEMGFQVEVRTSVGSLENLDRLVDADSPVNLAFAQADALQYFLDRNPGAQDQIGILESIGQECVFVITGKGQAVLSDEAMQAADDYRLGIASANSGVAITFNYMRSQVPGLGGVEVVYGNTGTAMAQLNEPSAGGDAVMVVHRPKEQSPEVARALREPGKFNFVSIGDRRLMRELPNGDKVYHGMNLAMRAEGDGEITPVQTICVKGLLLGNKQKMSPEQRDQMSDLVVLNWMKVFVTE